MLFCDVNAIALYCAHAACACFYFQVRRLLARTLVGFRCGSLGHRGVSQLPLFQCGSLCGRLSSCCGASSPSLHAHCSWNVGNSGEITWPIGRRPRILSRLPGTGSSGHAGVAVQLRERQKEAAALPPLQERIPGGGRMSLFGRSPGNPPRPSSGERQPQSGR